jgi:hypothetical protein
MIRNARSIDSTPRWQKRALFETKRNILRKLSFRIRQELSISLE